MTLKTPPMRPVAVWLFCWLLLSGGLFALPLHEDTARELLLAKECLERGACQLGVASSVHDLTHGAFIVRVLELIHLLHLPWAAFRVVTTALLAAAAALAIRDLRIVLGSPLSWLTFAIPIAWVGTWFDPEISSNVSPMPFFCAVFLGSLLRCAMTGSPVWAMVSAAGLGMAADCELGALAALPVALFIVTASARRLPLTLLASAAAFVAGPLLFSPRIWQRNVESLFETFPTEFKAAVAALVLAAIAGLIVRRRWARSSERTRLLVTLVTISVAVRGAVLVAVRTGLLASASDRFFGAAWEAEVFLIVLALRAIRARLPERWGEGRAAGVASGVAAFLLLNPIVWRAVTTEAAMLLPRSLATWSVADVDALGLYLREHDYTWNDAAQHLTTNGTTGVVQHLLLFLPEATEASPDKDDLLILKVPRSAVPSALPAGWSTFPLGWQHVALVHSFRSVIDPNGYTVETRRNSRSLGIIAATRLNLIEATMAEHLLPHDAVWTHPTLPFAPADFASFGVRRGARIVAHAFLVLQPDWHLRSWRDGVEWTASCHLWGGRSDVLYFDGPVPQQLRLPDIVELAPGDEVVLKELLPVTVGDICGGKR